MKKTKIIFVIGGVISGIGKGILASSIGRILVENNYKIFLQKFDPYLNIDPGTMSPYEHGEVYVTKDGAETDLDIGYYERFLNDELNKKSSYSSGKILHELLKLERNGKMLGETIQFIPHLSNKIIEKIDEIKKLNKYDFLIIEIGGSIKDMELLPYLHAISKIQNKYPLEISIIYITYIMFLKASNEFKTKPAQNSIKTLLKNNLKPNYIFLRSEKPIEKEKQKIFNKIANISFSQIENIFNLPDVDNIYEIPKIIFEKKLLKKILNFFNMEINKPLQLENWNKFLNILKAKKNNEIVIMMLGKYIDYHEAYKSIIEALKIAAIYEKTKISFKWVSSEKISKENYHFLTQKVDGIVILPGFGKRGFEGLVNFSMINRNKQIPTLGICYGFQTMLIAEARLNNLKNATSREISNEGPAIFRYIDETKSKKNIGGSMKLGESEIKLKKDSFAYEIYQKKIIKERHRHRFEFNDIYLKNIENNDFIISGRDQKTNSAEICEMKNHPFYLGVQFHPEFKSYPLKNQQIFKKFIKSILMIKS